MANWKVTLGLAAGLKAMAVTSAFAGACDGVYEAEVPFCREECGQDRNLLSSRRSVLSQTLRAADANGDGRVATQIITTARRDESQPQRFLKGRANFLEREAGRVKTLTSAERTYRYTNGEPSGVVRAADSLAQLQRCRFGG